MRLIFLALFLIACAPMPSPSPSSQTLPSNSVLQRSLRSTVAIISQEDVVACSGVFVESEVILTAAHCVRPRFRIESPYGTVLLQVRSPIGLNHRVVTYSDYRRYGWHRTINFEVIAYDQEKDLALLRHNDDRSYDATVARLSRRIHRVGLPIFTIGHPSGVPFNLSVGFISAKISNESGAWRLYSSVPVFRGNSGGPVFDMNGQLVSICSQFAGAPHINRSIYVRTIKEFSRGRISIE